MNYRFFIFITILLINIGCKEGNKTNKNIETNKTTYKDKVLLLKKDSITFPIDNETALYSASNFQCIEINDKHYLFFANAYDNTLRYHELTNKKLSKKIDLEFVGKNGVGHIEDVSILHKKPNSLFLFNTDESKLYSLSQEGKVKFSADLYDFNTNIPHDNLFPYISESSYMISKNNDFFIPGRLDIVPGFFEKEVIIKHNIKSKKTSWVGKYSDVYKDNFWGPSYKYALKMTTDTNGKILLSYPVDPYIYEISEKGDIKQKALISSKYIKETLPFNTNMSYVFSDSKRSYEKEKIYGYSHSDYSTIRYDKFRDIYYRVAFIRPTEYEILKGNSKLHFSIIVFDNKLNRLGETELFSSSIYNTSKIVIFPEGLGLIRRDKYDKNDSELTFSIFKIEEVNE